MDIPIPTSLPPKQGSLVGRSVHFMHHRPLLTTSATAASTPARDPDPLPRAV